MKFSTHIRKQPDCGSCLGSASLELERLHFLVQPLGLSVTGKVVAHRLQDCIQRSRQCRLHVAGVQCPTQVVSLHLSSIQVLPETRKPQSAMLVFSEAGAQN